MRPWSFSTNMPVCLWLSRSHQSLCGLTFTNASSLLSDVTCPKCVKIINSHHPDGKRL